jgi:hypothetical protein
VPEAPDWHGSKRPRHRRRRLDFSLKSPDRTGKFELSWPSFPGQIADLTEKPESPSTDRSSKFYPVNPSDNLPSIKYGLCRRVPWVPSERCGPVPFLRNSIFGALLSPSERKTIQCSLRCVLPFLPTANLDKLHNESSLGDLSFDCYLIGLG